MHNKQDFIDYLRDFFRYRYSIKLPPKILDEWWEDLKEYESLDVYEAFKVYRHDASISTFSPKLINILAILKPKRKSKTNISHCHMTIDDKLCDGDGKYHAGDGRYFCELHYQDAFTDSMTKEFIKQYHERAKSLGISTKELFRIENKLTKKEMKILEENPCKIIAVLTEKK